MPCNKSIFIFERGGDSLIRLVPLIKYINAYTLQDANIHGILFSDRAQNHKIHGIIKYRIILIFESQSYKLSLTNL